MVVYDLVCASQHKFEGWFQSINDYQSQHERGLLCCPVCDSFDVRKIPSASYVNTGVAAPKETLPVPAHATPEKSVVSAELVTKLRTFLEKNSTDVGTQFTEKAKAMHYGEIDKQNIHGIASVKEMVELHEEGIGVLPLPLAPVAKKDLN